MKIRYLPSSPKFPLEEHVRNDVGATLCAAGFAEAVAMPQRGSKGNAWLEARLEQSRLAGPPSQYDTPVGGQNVEWGVQTQKSGQVHVIKRARGEVLFFDGPPQDCPASIVQQFLDASAVNPEANHYAIESAKLAQAAQDRKDRAAGRIKMRTAKPL